MLLVITDEHVGEMKPAQLAVSTLLPEYNRTLIRYTSENIAKEIEDIRRTDSNYTSLILGVDIAGFDLLFRREVYSSLLYFLISIFKNNYILYH